MLMLHLTKSTPEQIEPAGGSGVVAFSGKPLGGLHPWRQKALPEGVSSPAGVELRGTASRSPQAKT